MINILGTIFILLIYAGVSYVQYRIVYKFNPDIQYGVMLLPVYGYYKVLQAAVSKPGLYLTVSIIIPVVIGLMGEIIDSETIATLAQLISDLFFAFAIGSIGKKLGKRFWLYFVLALIPVINLIMCCVLAFDSSRPDEMRL